MLEYLKKEVNKTQTENGAAAFISTGSECLDLFATIGALRKAGDEEIIKKFLRAYAENPDIAMKLLFFARDIRGGLGERRVFRTILYYLAENEPKSLKSNIRYISEYGRFDDLLILLDTSLRYAVYALIREQLEADLKALNEDSEVSLLAKWLPSVNASNKKTIQRAKAIAKVLDMSDAEYRKTLVKLRAKIRIIENNLREKDYSFDYSKQPSKAIFKYRAAFYRNDGERYRAFLESVSKGERKLNAGTLMPYELIDPYIGGGYRGTFMRNISDKEKATLNATWSALPDFGNDENALAIVDTSGSMYWQSNPTPAAVALSLGLYLAEHNKGTFHNHFIVFSKHPQLIELKGDSFADKLRYIASFNEIGNTNIEAVFDLVLKAAVNNHATQEELPSKLIIISDMEFDACIANKKMTNFENARAKFTSQGYELPRVVFWNVASRNNQQPVSQNEQGVILVSGCTPRIFSMVTGDIISPYSYMLKVLGSERYAPIKA